MLITIIPYIATLVAAVGTFANALGKRWSFCVWMATNTFFALYCLHTGVTPLIWQYAFNLAMAIVGFVKWRKTARTPKKIRRITADIRGGVCPRCGADVNSAQGLDGKAELYCHGCGLMLRFPPFSAAALDGVKSITIEQRLAEAEKSIKAFAASAKGKEKK